MATPSDYHQHFLRPLNCKNCHLNSIEVDTKRTRHNYMLITGLKSEFIGGIGNQFGEYHVLLSCTNLSVLCRPVSVLYCCLSTETLICGICC